MADNKYQLSHAAAERYETQKVPAIFAPLARATLDAVDIPANAQVIDIACGTGIIGRLLADKLSGTGRIVGTDLNPDMIEVARQTMPDTRHQVEWHANDVTALPFADGEFDVAFCQQGLQFFPDRPAALLEIRRVLKPGGKLVLTCWRTISPLFQAVSDSLGNRVGEKTAKIALDPFSFRDGKVIAGLLSDAGFRVSDLTSLRVERALAPIRHAIREEILASPYEKDLVAAGQETVEAVVGDVEEALAQYQAGDRLIVPQEAHLFEAANPVS